MEGDLALLRHAEAHRALVLVGVTRLEQLLAPPRCGARGAPTGRSAPRPSRARASGARRGSAPRSRAWSARGRCPRCAARTGRPSRARGASCTVPSSRRRCAARLLEKARNVPSSAAMLVGAHVSTAGGLVPAHERAVERGCEAMQVFNQSPRAWRPTRWKPDDVAEFLVAPEARPGQVGDDPRGLPDQPGDQGPGDAQEVGRLADPRAAHGRRDQGRRRGAPPRLDSRRAAGGGAAPGGRDGEARAVRVGGLPPAPGEHRRRRQHHRPLVRGAA